MNLINILRTRFQSRIVYLVNQGKEPNKANILRLIKVLPTNKKITEQSKKKLKGWLNANIGPRIILSNLISHFLYIKLINFKNNYF